MEFTLKIYRRINVLRGVASRQDHLPPKLCFSLQRALPSAVLLGWARCAWSKISPQKFSKLNMVARDESIAGRSNRSPK